MLEGIGIVVAGLVGIGGLIVGIMADGRAQRAESAAKKANEFAETANSIATEALAQAAASNKIAEDANELSEKANALSERTLLHAAEESFVQWHPEWDATNTVLTLVNQGRDRAFQPSVVITGKELHVLGSRDDADPGEKISVPIPELIEQRAKVPKRRIGTVGGPSVAISGRFRFPVSIVVLWKTEHGFQRQERIEFEIREGNSERSGIIL